MLMCLCDLCQRQIGPLKSDEERTKNQLKVTMGGQNVFIGDICTDCDKRVRALLNLPKEEAI